MFGGDTAAGLRLALSWLTVVPVRIDAVSRRQARIAIALAPLVGALLGLLASAALAGLSWSRCPPLVAGALILGLLTAATRGMHVDGLADTADALGCYGPPERALAVMKDSTAGPFAIVVLVVVLGAEIAALAALSSSGRWWAVGLAVTAGRAAFCLCCRRGYPAARQEGLGALVAGSQPWWVPTVWWLALAGLATGVVTGRWWLGPVAILLAATVVLGLTAHVRRRFGGVTGDVLGAASELAVAVTLIVCSFGG